MVISQGHLYWANLPDPTGSGPGFRRPVLVVQGDDLNRSRIRTVVCVPLTSNLTWAEAPSNALLPARATGLPKDSVAIASQIITVDRELLTEEVGKLSKRQDDINVELYQLGGKLREPIPLPLRISVLGGDILSFYVATLAQRQSNSIGTRRLASRIEN